MSIEDNKKLVREYLAASTEHSVDDFTKMERFLTDDASWWIIGDTKVSGEHRPVREFLKLATRIFGEAARPYQFRSYQMTAEDDRVSVTGKGYLPMKSGQTYSSDYNFLFKVRKGKICSIREYLDTQHFKEIIGQ